MQVIQQSLLSLHAGVLNQHGPQMSDVHSSYTFSTIYLFIQEFSPAMQLL